MKASNSNDCDISEQINEEVECLQDTELIFDDWVGDNPSSKCLFCDSEHADHSEMFNHCHKAHNFNIVSVKEQLDLDFYNFIKFVNYIRKEKPLVDDLKNSKEFNKLLWSEGEEYLMPALQDDNLLCFDIEADLEEMFPDIALAMSEATHNNSNVSEINNAAPSSSEYQILLAELKESRKKVIDLQNKLELAMDDQSVMRKSVRKLLDVDSNEKPTKVTNGHDDDDNDAYFGSYSHWNIHESMLKDAPRTLAYKDSISLNSDLFVGKTVLDIGCGTSILSMFAAKAGAGKVLAVDQSKILFKAMQIVKENNLQDVIECIKGKIEDIDLPVKEVDIIISEWMGYFLLFESMLDSVLWARDCYLKPDGLLLPNKCSMFIGGFESNEMTEKKVNFWDDVYGFRMSCMKGDVLADASIEVLEPEAILTDICTIKTLDLMTCGVKDLEFTSTFTLRPLKDGYLTGFFGFFETLFDLPRQTTLTTSPSAEPTHWQQTLFLLETPQRVTKDRELTGELVCKKSSEDKRSLDIIIHFGGKKLRYYLD